tara:strand:- start:319 stop:1170 length:852 start_codon:yes stop_codon:yes gene_type:complete
MALSITKATVGGSEDTWGTTTNTALDNIVSEINNNADGTNATTPNMTSLQIGGVAMTSTAAELNKLDGATVTTAEINILDGDTSATSTTVVDADRVVFNDDGTMKQVALSDIKTYINASAGSGSVTSVGVTVPTGLSVSPSTITTSGTFAISLASGYSIPTTSSQSNWDTAYGWGDHSTQGYLTSAAPTSAQVGSATAGLSFGAVGSYALLGQTTAGTFFAGTTYSGSSLKASGFLSTSVYSDSTAATIDGSAPSGTWRAMGTADRQGVVNNRAPSTLFLRIS